MEEWKLNGAMIQIYLFLNMLIHDVDLLEEVGKKEKEEQKKLEEEKEEAQFQVKN